ncbi:hypothetical protein IHE45_02G038300 [Dioscorea alata]|uniref:Uncharacterized protein n=1 Tax=Dioscorea alata TaxID=55571 RepID=A0ACB7WPZ6_DIOAL|nr:hypothetical protein IHE45_02G038300 [Dioscorea alata]
MADLLRRRSAALWVASLAVLLAGAVSAAALARTSLPYSLALLSSLPRAWSSFRSWLSPPYLFAAIHFIIIVIWKLSDKKQSSRDADPHSKPRDPLSRKPSAELWTEIRADPLESDSRSPDPVVEQEKSSNGSCITDESLENETMDATWKAIMEAAASPARPQLRKSETWERTDRAPATEAAREPVFRHSATFKESSGWRGREVLMMGHEELDQRFEAFIRMNREEMRLQREESNRRYLEMVNGGA